MKYEIEDLNENSFTVNGAPKTKVYHMLPGTDDERVTLINSYDSTDVLFRNVHVDDITINLNSFNNSSDAMLAFEELKKKVVSSNGGNSGSISSASEFTSRLLFNLESGLSDQKMVILSDSTGDQLDEWAHLLTQHLATILPGIFVHLFLYEGPNYGDPIYVQAGNTIDSKKLEVYIGGVSGTGISYAYDNFSDLVQVTPDVLIFSYGHNDNYVSQDDYYRQYFKLTKFAKEMYPDVAISLIAQNPKAPGIPTIENGIRNVNNIYKLAANEGYGFINVMKAFFDFGDYSTLLTDGTHPNLAGSTLWMETVAKSFDSNFSGTFKPDTKQDKIFIPASEMYTSNGDFTELELAGPVNMKVLTMPPAQDITLSAGVLFPKHWKIISANLVWTVGAGAGGAQNAYFNFYSYTLTDGAPQLDASSATWNLSGGYPAAGQITRTPVASVYGISQDYLNEYPGFSKVFAINKLGTSINDTITEEVRVLGIEFERLL